jgi:hypothetical protein
MRAAGLGKSNFEVSTHPKLFNKFVERGREMVGNGAEPLNAKDGKEPGPTYVSEKKDTMTHEIISKLDNAAKFVQEKVFGAVEPSGVSRDEVKDLSDKVNKLTETVAILVQKLEETGKTGAKARTTP